MTNKETDYYLIEGGTAKQLFDHWNAKSIAQRKKRHAFLKRFGVEKFYTYHDEDVAGLVFEKTPDTEVWKLNPKGGWTPRRTTPEGKALYKEMRSLTLPSLESLSKEILGVGNVLCGLRMYWPGISDVAGKPVILMPNPFGEEGPPKPVQTKNSWRLGYEFKLVDGVRKLKRSEYWAMKEAEKPTPPPAKKRKAVAGVRKKIADLKAAKG